MIEGAGANACEYMTGGAVAILGAVGENFGAGMTGGMAFVHDPADRFALMANPEMIVWNRLSSAHWESVLRGMLEEHARRTGSVLAAELLADWPEARALFWQVCPKEMLTRLERPLADADSVAAE